MATVERFEELKVWQAARDVVNALGSSRSRQGTGQRDLVSRRFFLSSAFLGALTRILPQRAQRSLRKATREGEHGESVGSDVVSCVEDTGLFFWRGLSHARNKV